jgi:hypothetical protein
MGASTYPICSNKNDILMQIQMLHAIDLVNSLNVKGMKFCHLGLDFRALFALTGKSTFQKVFFKIKIQIMNLHRLMGRSKNTTAG